MQTILVMYTGKQMIDTGAAAFLFLSFKVVSSRNFAAGTVTAAVVNLLQSHSWGPSAVVAVLLLRLNIWPACCLLYTGCRTKPARLQVPGITIDLEPKKVVWKATFSRS